MPSWSKACSAALIDEPLQTLLQKLYIVGSILVSHTPVQQLRFTCHRLQNLVTPTVISRGSFLRPQVFCFLMSAIFQGISFFRWRRRTDAEKQQGWRHYGWFTGLCFVGSVAGAIAFAARIAQLSQNYPSRRMQMRSTPPTQAEYLMISSYRGYEIRFTATHFVFIPVELGSIMAAKLLVLHRLLKFSFGSSPFHRAWMYIGRTLFWVVILCNVIGFCANVTSAVHFSQATVFTDLAYNSYLLNDTVAGAAHLQSANTNAANAIRVSSVQRFCEVFVILIVTIAFLVVGAQFHRILQLALDTLFSAMKRLLPRAPGVNQNVQLINEASAQGKRLQRKVFWTFLILFFTVLSRAVFAFMYGLALAYQDYDSSCSPNPCDECKNVYSQILFWILFTPEFQQIVMIFASPFAQLVALWGMTGSGVLEQVAIEQVQLDGVRMKESNQRNVQNVSGSTSTAEYSASR